MLKLILVRLWREKRAMLMLLFGMCLATAFLALGPLYVQAVASADFDQRLSMAPQSVLRIDIENPERMKPDVPEIALQALGPYHMSARAYNLSGVWVPGRFVSSPGHTGGSHPLSGSWYRPYSYSSFSDLFTVVEGQAPAPRPDGNLDSPLEAVVTVGMTAETRIEVGTRIALSPGTDNSIELVVVGLVEPALAQSDAFWDEQLIFEPTLTWLSPVDTRTDISVIVNDVDFDRVVLPLLDTPLYRWRFGLSTDLIRARSIDDLEQRFDQLETPLLRTYPNLRTNIGLEALIARYRIAVEQAQGPVVLLSFLVLVLLLYNLATIASLILERQREEWAMIFSRGGSRVQLVLMQGVTVLLLGLIASVVGPILAYGLLFVLTMVGPQAAILDFRHLGSITMVSVLLSLLTAGFIIITLILPAWGAAQRSLLNLKRSAARQNRQPSWSRFYLDVLFLLLGAAFLGRSYSLVSNAGIESLLANPALLITSLANQRDVGLDDPFTLAGPVFLLAGFALLWMRVFPLLVRLFSAPLDVTHGLTSRLAFWTVERDPAHYAQLVLLLIGTLALGTASLSLAATREAGAWESALQIVGTDAVGVVVPRELPSPAEIAPVLGVQSAHVVTQIESTSAQPIYLVGWPVDATYPQEIEALADVPQVRRGGLTVPIGTTRLTLDVYAVAPAEDEPAIETRIGLDAVDGNGVQHLLMFAAPDPSLTESFQTHRLSLEGLGRGPWRIDGLRFLSVQGDATEVAHTVYLDQLVAHGQRADEQVLLDFEEDSVADWRWASGAGQTLETSSLRMATDRQTSGRQSLRVNYRRGGRSYASEWPLLRWQPKLVAEMPVVVSPQFAEQAGRRSPLRRTLTVGDKVTTEVLVQYGYDPLVPSQANFLIDDLDVPLEIIAIVEDFPSVPVGAAFVIARHNDLLPVINAEATPENYIGRNRIWFDLEERVPTTKVRSALSELPGVVVVNYAWDRYEEIQRDPLANAVSGMLFAGFWVSLMLSLLDFAFYMAMTVRRRATTFGVLRALGWRARDLMLLLIVEQAAFITPALIMGIGIGLILAYLILPFLALIGALTLLVPVGQIMLLVILLVVSFTSMLLLTTQTLRRVSLNAVMRFGDI